MPQIPGATGRGLRVLPWLGLGQAVGVLVSAGAGLGLLRAQWPWGMRLAAAAFIACGGVALSVGVWPPGPDGEPLGRWLVRLGRYALRRRGLGGEGRGWPGRLDIAGPYLVHQRGCAAILECGGSDPALGGEGAWEAAAAGYREFLHALEQPLQIVLASRWLREADRPHFYATALAPAGMAGVASAYAAHWTAAVASRRWVVRQVLLVPSAPGRNAAGRADVEATVACVHRLALRLGLRCRRLGGDELVHGWREWTGDACPGPVPDGRPGWRVRGWSDA